MKCQECNGTGRVALLTSVEPCEACHGTGRKFPKLRAVPPITVTEQFETKTAYVAVGSSGWHVVHVECPT